MHHLVLRYAGVAQLISVFVDDSVHGVWPAPHVGKFAIVTLLHRGVGD